MRRASSLATDLGVDEIAYRRLWNARRPDVVLGRCSFHDALAEIVSTLGGVPQGKVLGQLQSERVTQKLCVLHSIEPQVITVLEALRQRGLKLAVVSNCFEEDVAGWESSPLRPFFDVSLFSYAAHLVKPDRAIYLAACRQLDVGPHDALFVGDGADEVAGAQAAGLAARRALWFASRWPHTTVTRDDAGLWQPAEVLG